MAKKPDNPKSSVKTPRSKAHRPDVQPIGPALARLLNPAINRGEAGVGSTTGERSAKEKTPLPDNGIEKNGGLQPPPDNSWDRRAGGEAAAHRARASTRGKSDDVANRDSSAPASDTSFPSRGGGSTVELADREQTVQGLSESPQANYGTAATIPT